MALVLMLPLSLAAGLLASDLLEGVKGRTIVAVMAAIGLMALGLSQTSVWTPPALAARAAASPDAIRSAAGLGVMTAIALALCALTNADRLRHGHRRRSWRRFKGRHLEIPGRFGALVQKDLRCWRRALDPYFAVPIAAVTCVYLVTNPAPASVPVLIAAAALFMPLSSLVFNSFGFETRSGFDRYELLPLSWRDILLGKNVAWAIIAAAAFLLILPVALWRVGLAAGALAAIEAVLLGLAYLTWGNWMSVTHPIRTEAWRLSSAGPFAEAGLGMLFGSLPGALVVILASREHAISVWAIAGLLPLYVFLYLRSLTWSGRRLEQRWRAVRASLQ